MSAVAFHVAAVIFLATLIRSTFGFGEALVAVPLLVLRIPLTTATPLAVLFSVTVAGMIIAQDWRHVHARSAGWLLLATLPGIPPGLWLLTRIPEPIAKGVLGTIIILFSIYSLAGRGGPHLRRDSRFWMIFCGFWAGVLGGAYGMNGPPLAVYGAMRRWSPQHFRATLQGYFLPASLAGLVGYALTGLLSMQVVRWYLLSLPGAIAAILIGRFLNRRLSDRTFLRYIYAGLIGIGIILLAQAAR